MKELKVFYGEYKNAVEAEGRYYIDTVADSYDEDTKTIIVSVYERIATKFEKGYYKNQIHTEFGKLSVVVGTCSDEGFKKVLEEYKKDEEKNEKESINAENGDALKTAIRAGKYDRAALLIEAGADLDILNEVEMNRGTLIGAILRDYRSALAKDKDTKDIEKVLDMIKEKGFKIETADEVIEKAIKAIKEIKEEIKTEEKIEDITDEDIEEIEKETDVIKVLGKIDRLGFSKVGLHSYTKYARLCDYISAMKQLYMAIKKIEKIK